MLRLTIRRKLIGTLVITGFLPLVVLLVAVLSFGTHSRLETVSTSFKELARASSQGISDRIDAEGRRLLLLARLPGTIRAFELSAGWAPAAASQPVTTPPGAGLTHLPIPTGLLENPLARRMRIISRDNPQRFHFLAVNAAGNIIAADIAPDETTVATHHWFKRGMAGVDGRILIQAIAEDPHTHEPAVILVVPVRKVKSGTVIGLIKETVGIHTIERQLARGMGSQESTVAIYDTRLKRILFSIGSTPRAEKSVKVFSSASFGKNDLLSSLARGLVVGAAKVECSSLRRRAGTPVISPHWVVLVSQSAVAVLAPIFDQVRLVALLGLLMIIILFGLGFFISQREVISPLRRLRVAAAAVTRGELNVRLLSGDHHSSGFRHDELGELAHDFDAMTRSLQGTRHTLERREAAKSRFITIAAHELRTPIGALLGHLDLVKSRVAECRLEPEIQSRISHSLEVAISNGQRLETIVNELLKLVKEDRIAQNLRWQKVNMVDLVRSVCAEHADFFHERQLNLDMHLAENIPPIDGDEAKLRDALVNVVGNAIRFSPAGGTVRVAVRKVVGGMVEIDVEDSGPGMSQEAMGSLFEPFQPGDDAAQHSTAANEQSGFGLGLGLAIVRRFIDMHAGRVFIQKLPVGTRVRFILPIERFEPLPAANETSPSEGI